jgi:HAD superfamily hydrolase (TIGR01509 family)
VIRAVVFDFDGVIANSEPLHFSAYADVLAAAGVVLTKDEYYGRYLGYDDAGAFKQIGADRGAAWDDARIHEFVRRKALRMEELERAASVLFPGAAEAIRRLAAAYPLAIASGALRAEIVRVLDREGLSRYFAAIVAAEDTPASKPAPDPYVKAVGDLRRVSASLEPADCVAVEDSRWGLESARAAGLRTIAVSHTYSAEVLEDSADVTIASLDWLTMEFLSKLA